MTRSARAELGQDAHSLRRLAAALVGEQHADDLVQETALALLQHERGRDAPPHSLRAWLHRVVRHLAGKERRARRRWQQHAPNLPAAEPDPTPALAAERRELLQRLHAALLELPEPYQATLLLRFHGDLRPARIAAATGVPLATVKSRLQRGLAMLRERLDADGRGDWRPAMVAFAAPRVIPAASAAAYLLHGALLMTTITKLMLAAAALLAAALWTSLPRAPEPPATVAGAPVPTHGGVAAAAGESPAHGADVAARRDVEAAAASASSYPLAADPRVTLRGRCVDESRHPLAEVVARLRSAARGATASTAAPWSGPAPVTTAADGLFACAFPPPVDGSVELELLAADRCPAGARFDRLAPGTTIDLGDVTLPRGVRVQGRIVDASGSPVAGADIEVVRNRFATNTTPRVIARARARVTSRPDGTFGPTPPLPPGDGYLSAHNVVLAEARLPLTLDAAQPLLDVLVTVPAPGPIASIRGRIVDDQEVPVANALVLHGVGRARSGPDGAFTLLLRDPDNGPGPLRLHVVAEGYDDVRTEPIAIGARDVTIRLQRRRSLVVCVRDEANQPVEAFGAVLLAKRERGFQSVRRAPVAERPGGTLDLTDLPQPQTLPCSVWVVPRDPTLAAPAPVPLHVAGDAVTTVTLRRARQRRLRVVAADGSPLAAVQVELVDAGGTELSITGGTIRVEDGSWPFTTRALLVQRGVTDASGELVLAGPGDRELALRLSGAGLAPQTLQPVRLSDAGPLVVTAARGATWRGRLSPADVAAEMPPERVAGAADAAQPRFGIVLSRERLRLPPLLERPLPIAPDGSFAFDGLPPGTWDVLLVHEGLEIPLGQIVLEAGAELQHDLDVSAQRRATLSLRVLVDGAPWAGGAVHLWIQHRARDRHVVMGSTSARTDADGHAQVRCLPGLLAPSLFVANGRGGMAEVVLPTTIELAPGQQATHVLDVRLQQPLLRVVAPDGAPAAGVVLTFAHACDRTMWTKPTDARGEVRAPRLVAGTYRVRTQLGDEEIEIPLTIPAAPTATLEVHLPRAAPR